MTVQTEMQDDILSKVASLTTENLIRAIEFIERLLSERAPAEQPLTERGGKS